MSRWRRPVCLWFTTLVSKVTPCQGFVNASFGVESRRRSSRDVLRSKLRTAVYPRRMALIGAKLWQNAFQTIPDIWFFDVQNFFGMKFLEQKVSTKSKIVRYGAATQFWVFLADCQRKITLFPLNFKSLRPLVMGFPGDFLFVRCLFAQNQLTFFLWGWRYDGIIIW